MVLARNRKTISGAPITYGQNIEPHGLSWFPSVRPGRQVPTAMTSPLPRRTESVAWHQRSEVRRGSGCGLRLTFWAISLATNLHGLPRIRNGNNPRFERLLVLRWQKVVVLRLTGQPGRRFPHECFSKPQFAEFMNLMRGDPRQSAAADVCMAHWFHATDRAC
jgi:hypothetical protein